MKQQIKMACICLAAALCDIDTLFAQMPGSSAAYSGFVTISGTQNDISESLYIGPGTYQIDGTWEIYAQNVVIDPAAVISGSGTMRFNNPSVAGGIAGSTRIDGNNATSPLDVNVVLNNPMGMVIAEIDFPADLVAASFSNNAANSTIHIGKSFDMAVDGANVVLGNPVQGDFSFDNDAVITNYGVNRMVITNNSTTSHMVKANFTGPFVFPIGIAAGDYTPATITPASPGNVHVSVQDYTNAPPTIIKKLEGMDRTWHVFADTPLPVTMTLQHNSPATDGSSYIDSQAFIAQNQGNGQWSSPGTVDFIASGVHTHANYTLPGTAAAEGSYFSKSSDADSPLPVTLISLEAVREGAVVRLNWRTSTEYNSHAFEIERSTDSRNWHLIGVKPSNGTSNTVSHYEYIDADPVIGIGYYRLKMIDNDASFAYSRIIPVREGGGRSRFAVYPNPASHTIHLTADLSAAKALQIYNMGGKLVASPPVASEIDISNLATGIYSIVLTGPDRQQTAQKIVVVR